MGFKVFIKGVSDEIVLEKESILSINYLSDTPDNSSSRATDLNVGVIIEGKIGNQKEEQSKKLALWSLVPSESEEAYKNLNIEILSAGTMVRKIEFPNCFIVDYSEKFNVKNGDGIFSITLRQKKEKIDKILIEGGYSAR